MGTTAKYPHLSIRIKRDDMKFLANVISILPVVFVLGCWKDGDIKAKSASGDSADVLVVVGSRTYTKGDLVKDIDFRVKYTKYMRPDCDPKILQTLALKASEQLVPAFIQNAIVSFSFDQYAKTNGHFAVAVDKIRSDIESKYVEAMSSKTNFNKIREDMKKLGILEAFDRNFENELKTDALMKNVYSNAYPIGEEEIRRFHKAVVLTNGDSAKTNELIAATMTNVVRSLKNGADFYEMHDKYDMSPEFAKVDFGAQYIEADFKDMPGLWEKLRGMEEGETTDVVDAIDSWHIYKIEAKIPADNSNSNEESLKLSRIYFRRAGTFEPYTDQEVIEALTPIRNEKILELITAIEVPHLKIEYPCGVDYFKSKQFEKLDEFIKKIKAAYERLDKLRNSAESATSTNQTNLATNNQANSEVITNGR